MQGLSRYEEDNNIKADYIVIEMARGILGETWQDDFVQKAKNGRCGTSVAVRPEKFSDGL